jgi:hypothetical protein
VREWVVDYRINGGTLQRQPFKWAKGETDEEERANKNAAEQRAIDWKNDRHC